MCIGLCKKAKFEIVNNPEEAEIIIINTCGFIESAKEEAINCILEMAEYKKQNCKYLVAMGCLVQRYKNDLEKTIPEVDRFISIDEYEKFGDIILELTNIKSNSKNTLDYLDRVVSTGDKTAYLKIAEGCSNRCTYCAIPYIRGPYISRKKEDILDEAKKLAEDGYEEIIVIAQDTTKYGIDIYGKEKLAELLHEISKIEKIKWIRFLYAYPESITDELIFEVKNNPKICKYFDIPLQHFSDNVLKRMNRKSNSQKIKELLEKLRKEIPEVVIRTTVIVGFPGETEDDFFELYEFISEAKFEKLGAFKYSKEDGTPAAKLDKQVHYKTKQSRYNKIMAMQQKISKIKLEEKIGNTYEVLIDGLSEDGKYYIGRSYMDIPDEDGVIYIKNNQSNLCGKFIKCKITGVINYDLIGNVE
ncbi:MAG: 30S ribosomal protein S12 methylthiotransferase RimO [Clostridia bacterium]|nr:30S ribosomal protein S12 methylthiotransferase RimO [Clostridia bacterium]